MYVQKLKVPKPCQFYWHPSKLSPFTPMYVPMRPSCILHAAPRYLSRNLARSTPRNQHNIPQGGSEGGTPTQRASVLKRHQSRGYQLTDGGTEHGCRGGVVRWGLPLYSQLKER